MKFNFLVLSVCLASTIFLSSCGKDSDENELSGTYTIFSIEVENCNDPDENVSLEFGDDGCIVEQGLEFCVDGGWTFTNGNYTLSLNVTFDGNPITDPQNTSGTYELDGSTITLCDGGTDCEEGNIRFDGDTITIFGITTDDGCEQTLIAKKN